MIILKENISSIDQWPRTDKPQALTSVLSLCSGHFVLVYSLLILCKAYS